MLDGLKKRRANAHNEEGRRLMAAGDLAGAQKAFESAIKIDPEFRSPWFNLALVHKWRHEWAEAIRCNQRVVELSGTTTDEPAWWNMGIAATALRDWQTARRAWRSYGVPLADGEGPIEDDFGLAPIRIDPAGKGEVVWARRIDPARAIIRSVPLPDSGRAWGDCILHDGVPNGERMLDGKPRSVFDEIEVWERSGVPTLVAEVHCASKADADELAETFFSGGHAAEDWTTIQILCKACSEGRVDVPHDHSRPTEWSGERRFGLASPEDDARRYAAEWSAVSPGDRRVLSMERAL